MSEFSGAPLDAHIPDDLTVAEFMLEYQHPLRPAQGTIPCLIEDATGRAVSLEELRERTFALAQSLRAKYNIGEKQVVLLFSPNHVDYPAALWASQYLGAIFTGANPSSTPPELVYQLKLTEATLIIAHSSTLETAAKAANMAGLPSDRVIILDSDPGLDVISVATLISDEISCGSKSFVPRRLRPGEGKTTVAAICMSSGTTGQPKGVAMSHTAIIANLIQLTLLNHGAHEFWCPGDVVLAVLPFFHVAGLIFNIHWMLFCATTLVVIPKFEFVGMLNSIVRHGIQHLMMVPPIALALCKHPAVKKYDLSRIKFLGSGAAPMTSELQNQLSQVCPQAKVGQAYGLTETAGLITMTPIFRPCSPGSVGMLLPGTQARLVKSDGSLAGYDEPGELVIKTPSMSLGYYKNPEASAETFSNDGWLRTGDEAKISKNGEIWITDRLKELIKVQGFQASPAELEGLILNHPDVSDTCVVGVPDERSGEVPRAFVVLTEAAQNRAKIDPEPIKASIQKLVADNKNASGKILRRILREQVKEEYQTKAKL
ncbi:phenylacetyl-CoA ligase [Mycena alexandri]|uniref:Phenylacetyl-CoA ligase n=1 Tax=Mycena alexandri TaxID=1745969 RepID=A0AAD6THA6_9AGAR|nr:phenylacetyl-CoA ligase [Mycena alexandri]